MYTLKKTFTLECAHQLFLPYESDCNRLHGHSYHVTVEATGKTLNQDGMIADFKDLAIAKGLDHQNLNVFLQPSTAEKLAQYIHTLTKETIGDNSVSLCVHVKETESSEVIYYE